MYAIADKDPIYKTNDEIIYLESSLIRQHDKKAFLVGYLEGCSKRTNWAEIKKENVMNMATTLLNKLG
jgi:hypothetical protein